MIKVYGRHGYNRGLVDEFNSLIGGISSREYSDGAKMANIQNFHIKSHLQIIGDIIGVIEQGAKYKPQTNDVQMLIRDSSRYGIKIVQQTLQRIIDISKQILEQEDIYYAKDCSYTTKEEKIKVEAQYVNRGAKYISSEMDNKPSICIRGFHIPIPFGKSAAQKLTTLLQEINAQNQEAYRGR